MKLVPVSITPGATAKVPDQFTVLYGSGALVANPTVLSTIMLNGNSNILLSNPTPLARETCSCCVAGHRHDCSLLEVTGQPPGPGPPLPSCSTGCVLPALGHTDQRDRTLQQAHRADRGYGGVGSPTAM